MWAASALYALWWSTENPLPDGFQNEYLHVGNAFDLWGAVVDRDVFHMRWYMYTGYWPWAFYAVPWPFLVVLGTTRLALVAGNLVHLAVMLWGAGRLGRTLGAPLTPYLLLLCPGVFGSLVRVEPNLADIAWTIAGIAFLVESRGLRSRGHALGWGACLGIGLMMDRLTVGFFLVPAVLPLLFGLDSRGRRNLGLATGLTLLLTAAYYREFFLRQTAELLGQAPIGEIDSAGHVLTTGAIVPGTYYGLALVDSQAGPVIGALMLWGAGSAIVGLWRGRQTARTDGQARATLVLLAAVIPAVLFFTLVAKKQVFYTLPVLGPLAVLAAGRGRWAWLGVGGGLVAAATLGLGLLPTTVVSGPIFPPGWVVPRHTLARPPSHETWPFDAVAQDMQTGEPLRSVLVMSEDQRLFGGYLALALRERLPDAGVRTVLGDPGGAYEFIAHHQYFVWAGRPGGGWPTEGDIEAELIRDHYDLEQLPPVAHEVAALATEFDEVGRYRGGPVADPDLSTELIVYRRRVPPTPE